MIQGNHSRWMNGTAVVLEDNDSYMSVSRTLRSGPSQIRKEPKIPRSSVDHLAGRAATSTALAWAWSSAARSTPSSTPTSRRTGTGCLPPARGAACGPKQAPPTTAYEHTTAVSVSLPLALALTPLSATAHRLLHGLRNAGGRRPEALHVHGWILSARRRLPVDRAVLRLAPPLGRRHARHRAP